MGEYVTRMVPMGTHEWSQYINIEDLERMITEGGGQTLSKAGLMITNPITFEMDEFPQWHRGNYMVIAKK